MVQICSKVGTNLYDYVARTVRIFTYLYISVAIGTNPGVCHKFVVLNTLCIYLYTFFRLRTKLIVACMCTKLCYVNIQLCI
jgi:hypothetical protein